MRPSCAPDAIDPAAVTGWKGYAMHAIQRYAVILVALAATAGAAPGQTGSRVVYFQVSYASGDVKDLSHVPADNKGILNVTRITRIKPAGPSYKVFSTHGRPVRSINPGRTERVDLTWDGKAWVGPKPKPVTVQTTTPNATAPPAATGMTAERGPEIVRTERLLAALRRLETKYAAAQIEANRARTAAGDEQARASAQKAATKAKIARNNCTKALGEAEQHLADLLAGKVLAPTARGVSGGQLAPAVRTPRGAGVIRPVEDSAVLPHRVQVWPLEAGTGRRTYRISMAHTEAGIYGAFYYVAYADTNGDHAPDKLIARSPLAQADRAGGWTVWTFETDAQRVFAGNTWQRDDTTQFSRKRKRHDRNKNWSGLPDEIYVSGFFGGMPTTRHKFWPYLHNIRVQLNDPKRHRRRGKAEIIIRK